MRDHEPIDERAAPLDAWPLIERRRAPRLGERSGAWWPVLVVALLFGLAAHAGVEFTRSGSRVATFWAANGLLLAWMLCTSPARGRQGLAAAALVNVGVNLLAGDTPATALVLAACNALEVGLAALLLRPADAGDPDPQDLGEPRALRAFALYACGVAPAASALAAALLLGTIQGASLLPVMHTWFLSDALGMAVVTPVALLALRGELPQLLRPGQRLAALLALAALLGAGSLVFLQSRYPLFFLVFPVLVVVALRLGQAGTAVAVLLLSLMALGASVAGLGPLALIDDPSPATRMLVLQGFLLAVAATGLPLAAMRDDHRRIRTLLGERETELLQLTRGEDIVLRLSGSGHLLFVAPTIEPLLGHTPASLARQPLQALAHPDDRPDLDEALERVRRDGDSVRVAWRARHRDAHYRWVQLQLRPLPRPREPGASRPDEIVGSARPVDVGQLAALERRADERLQARNEAIDPLTGLPRREALAERLALECARALRERVPLTLVALEIDQYAAHAAQHGAAAGDECVRSVAQLAGRAAARSGDLVFRDGEAGFLLLLPDTSGAAARRVAERIHDLLALRNLPHEASALGRISVSIGLASLAPPAIADGPALQAAAADALQRARTTGPSRTVGHG